MLEFTGSIHDIGILIGFCDNLEKVGSARKIKDSSYYDKQTEGFIEGKGEHIQNRFSTKVYTTFLIKIENRYSLKPIEAKVRFWKDKRLNVAGVKVSEEGLVCLLHSVTVVKLLQKMNIELGSDGLELDKIAEVMTMALNKVTPVGKFNIKEVKD